MKRSQSIANFAVVLAMRWILANWLIQNLKKKLITKRKISSVQANKEETTYATRCWGNSCNKRNKENNAPPTQKKDDKETREVSREKNPFQKVSLAPDARNKENNVPLRNGVSPSRPPNPPTHALLLLRSLWDRWRRTFPLPFVDAHMSINDLETLKTASRIRATMA